MALPILDGNQSPTTLSTIIVSNAHISAHTVVSLGTQAITDIATAVSGVELGPNTLNALENITVTLGQVTITGGLTDAQLRASAVTIGGGIYLSEAQVVLGGNAPAEAVQVGGYNLADNKLYPIAVDSNGVQSVSGTVTANGGDFASKNTTQPTSAIQLGFQNIGGDFVSVKDDAPLPVNLFVNDQRVGDVNVPISGTVTANVYSGEFIKLTTTGYIAETWILERTGPTSWQSIGNGKAFVNFNEGTGVWEFTQEATSGVAATNGSEISSLPPETGWGNFNQDISSLTISYENPLARQVFGTVTIGNSVTIGSLPAISGTVTASVTNSVTVGSLPVQLSTTTIGGTARLNVTLSSATTVGATAPSYANLYGGSDGTNLRAISVDSSGRTVVTGSVSVANTTVTVSALPSGALTTRFGSVTTANTPMLTAAVTNSARKYLLAQNISAGTVTIGIGFSPTTTQGIQLSAGGGISFDSFCPTGAVWWLSATTGANFTILEG